MVEFLSDGLKAATVVLLFTFVYVVIRHEKMSFRKVILMAFLFTLIGYQLAYWQRLQAYPVFNAICFFLSMQVLLAFWIMSKAFFDDEFNWNWKYWILVSLVPALHYLLYRFNEWEIGGFSEDERFLPYLLSVFFFFTGYQLRRAINGELGHTNFNAFLNHYRIKEALRLLKEEEGLTFQEIAYRMGYQSVATINRAFKKETGQTPTEFSGQLIYKR